MRHGSDALPEASANVRYIRLAKGVNGERKQGREKERKDGSGEEIDGRITEREEKTEKTIKAMASL